MAQHFFAHLPVRLVRILFTLALAVTSGVLVGCGESTLQSASPLAPSPLVDGSQMAPDARTGATSVEPRGFHTSDDEDSDSDSDSDGDGPGDNEVEIQGAIDGPASGCPTASFTVDVGTETVVVTTDGFTVFHHGLCTDLTVGRWVEVKGHRANGSIAATRVELFEEEEDE
jgi:hypothetical protein